MSLNSQLRRQNCPSYLICYSLVQVASLDLKKKQQINSPNHLALGSYMETADL